MKMAVWDMNYRLYIGECQLICQQIGKNDLSSLSSVDLLPEVILLGDKLDQQLNFVVHFMYVYGHCFYQD